MRLLLGFLSFALCGPAMAGDAKGMWLTGPDAKGQVGHVRMAPCGAALCGTIVRAYDKAGREVRTPNVGKRVIWDVRPTSGGGYEGRMHVSQLRADVMGKFEVSGSAMLVKGCLGKLCQAQRWTRLE